MWLVIAAILCCLSSIEAVSHRYIHPEDWAAVDAVIQEGIKAGAFPGAVALVGSPAGEVYSKAFGAYTYGDAPPFVPPGSGSPPSMKLDTRFDMASCTKVVATLTAVGILYDLKLISLDMKVSDPALLGPAFANNGKDDITLLNCLLHNAGYPPDPVPNYWDPAFGCPQTTKPMPAEDFSCRDQIFTSLLNQTLAAPIGSVYVYSDLSFLTLMWVVGKVVQTHAADLRIRPSDLLPGCASGSASDTQCYYEVFVRRYVFQELGMVNSGFLVPAAQWDQCAPCENDTVYTHKVIQGQVSDGNAYALGGIAGHAGLFSTAGDTSKLMQSLMYGRPSPVMQPDTVAYFSKEYNHSQSSRAIGWNTNDPLVNDEGWNQSCMGLSPRTYMHTGYTGTEICADPDLNIYTILFTNRVYPTDANIMIRQYRQFFNQAVANVFKLAKQRYWAAIRADYATLSSETAVDPSLHGSQTSQVIPFQYPMYKQCNASWGDDVMQVETICQVGCLMSSVSMALGGRFIPINGVASDPQVLNHWLQKNNGYVYEDELEEGVIPNISPAHIDWIGPAYPSTMTRDKVISLLQSGVIVIANVDDGQHFVLMTGYDTDASKSDWWYVNDPGFTRDHYLTSDIVGYRLFNMTTPHGWDQGVRLS